MIRIGPSVCEDDGPGPTNSSGGHHRPLRLLHNFKVRIDALRPQGAPAGVCANRIQLAADRTIAAAMALRIMKERRSEPAWRF